MKLCSFSFPLFATLLLLMTGCASSVKTKPAQKAAATPAPAGASAAGAPVVTTPSGLRYQVLASGPADGKSPTLNDSVTVHYKGTLTNGTVFDSSYERGAPATFGVSQVIPGWTEALQLMKPGDQWLLYLPANIAYGPRSMGDIPANSDLVFQVHLLQVVGVQ
jgi:FKBP-type peptidyl-prolyl cis-trans isomerase FklB